jgi:hypothetical protein
MSADREDSAAEGSPAVAKNATVDAIVAAIVFIFGAVVVFESRRLGATWTSDGPGAGYFPFYIGLIACISSLGILYQATLGKGRDVGTFIDRRQLGRVASVLLPALVYVFAIWLLGIYIASALYICVFMIVLGKYNPMRSIVLGIVINASFFVLFEAWFKVPLYKGVLDPLRFLGY